jgi:hypothetical protein
MKNIVNTRFFQRSANSSTCFCQAPLARWREILFLLTSEYNLVKMHAKREVMSLSLLKPFIDFLHKIKNYNTVQYKVISRVCAGNLRGHDDACGRRAASFPGELLFRDILDHRGCCPSLSFGCCTLYVQYCHPLLSSLVC